MTRSSSPATQVVGARARAALPGSAPALSAVETVAPGTDPRECEADRIADAVVQGATLRAPGARGWSAAGAPDDGPRRDGRDRELGTLWRKPAAPDTERGATVGPHAAAVPTAEASAAEPRPETTAGLLVPDEMDAERGQMRKTEFMAALRAEVCASVDAGLAGTDLDSEGCPWIDHWLGYYDTRSPADIERALRRFAPEAAAATSAREYLPFVAARVQASAQRWARTGEISGVPEGVPASMPGGSVLADFGGMFFKARPGGPGQANVVSVRRQLGCGEAMPGGLRSRMEGAFGTRLAGVRLHTDATAARLANELNARAFAVGPHVAFATGEFQPGTPAGDALIAHELAHVVQQGQHDGTPAMRKGRDFTGGTSSPELESDADRSAAGVAAGLWGRESFGELRRQAKPRARSGLRLQRCASTPKTPAATPQAKAKSAREERDAALADAGKRLREVTAWASTQQKIQNVPDIKGVRNLDPEQAENVQKAIDLLTHANELLGTKAADDLPAKLDEIVGFAKTARKYAGASGGGDALSAREFDMQRQHAANQAVNAADEATAMVERIGQSLDVTEVRKHTDAIAAALNSMQNDAAKTDDAVDEVTKHAKAAKQALSEVRKLSDRMPKAIGRIIFVLRSFLALNAPGRVTPPSADEVKSYAGTLRGSLADDFSTVFGEGKVTHGFDVFVVYADVLESQLAVRAKMAAAKVEAASPIPTQGNAEDWFKSLKGKGNDEVLEAYTTYANAYFFHRVVDKFNDMDVADVSELYQRPLSIFGLRPLVCTGYALLGSHLLRKAGATLKEYIVAVRATDDDIVGDKIDEGHAIAHMSRKGKDFWVSNDMIVFSENDGIGPEAVAWDHKASPLHKASGSTIPGANAKLRRMLGDLAEAIEKRRGGKKK